MNGFPVPLKYIAVALLSGVLVLIGVLNLLHRAAWVDPTDGVFWTEKGGELQAAAIEPGSPGGQAAIHQSDKLLAIDGKTIANLGQYYDLLYQSEPGSILRYTLQSGNETRNAVIQLGSKALMNASDHLRTLLAFLHLGIGLFVLIRGIQLPRTLHFYLLCLAAFVVYLFSWTPALKTLDWWVYGFSVVAFLLLPALFVHFSLRFPVDSASGRKFIPPIYTPALILVLLQLLWMTGNLAPLALPRTAVSSGILDQVQLAYFSVGFISGAVLLLKHRIKAQNLMARQQMKWISYGALAGIVPFSLIYVVPTLLGTRASFAMEASMLSLGLIPLTFGYALVRFRLMDVEVIARKSAAYLIASTLLLSLYLLFVLLVGRIFQWLAPQADFLAICLAVLAIALLFAPLRNAIQVRLDRLFYRDQFEDRSTLLNFAQTLSSEINLVPLASRVLDRILKAFQIQKASLFLSDQGHNGFFRRVQTSGPDCPLLPGLLHEDELVASQDSVSLSGLKKGSNFLYLSCPALMQEGFYYQQDLMLRGRRVGIIALGQLPTGRHFSSEDLDLLAALAGYAAMALENASLYHSIEIKALELERLKAYTENIIESINVAVLALDSEGRVTSCNRAFEDLFGAGRPRIVGFPVETILPEDAIASIRRAAGRAGWEPAAPAHIFKLSFSNKIGARLIVNLSLIPMQAAAIGQSGSLIVMDNITEKVQLEDQLLQAEKLSSIGLLAAGIAHEVNTPIAGISSYTQMLLKETPETDRRKPILEKIEKQTFRAAEIVSGLLNFSRLNSSEFRDLDVNQLIEESLTLLNHQLELNNIKVESRFDPSLPPIYGNMGKLQQVFVNLFLNARDAMPSGGEIAVQTGMTESMVVVDISDTGLGISDENIRRIFDPFFTTKSVGKGTGLGLAVSYGIIQEHGGGIFVDSSSGKGTHFRVKLPTRLH